MITYNLSKINYINKFYFLWFKKRNGEPQSSLRWDGNYKSQYVLMEYDPVYKVLRIEINHEMSKRNDII